MTMNLRSVSIGLCVASAATVLALASPPQAPVPAAAPQAQPPAQPTFRGGVELINLSVTVTDNRGRNVTDLQREDFLVAEDGKVQEIVDFRSVKEATTTPIGLGFMVDASKSMERELLDSARTAIESVMGRRSRNGDEFFVVAAGSTIEVAQDWTPDRRKAVDAIRRIKTRAQEGSILRNGVMAALDILKKGTHKKQVLVIITDGDPQGGDRSTVTTEAVAQAARASDAIVYAIVLDQDEAGAGNRSVGNNRVRQAAAEWSRISDATGGRTHYTQGFQQVEDAVEGMGKEFAQQYEVSYQRGVADSRYHQIVVGVKRKDVTIRHRRGYLASAPAQ